MALNYQVLRSDTADGLAGIVNNALNTGWKLEGGISVAIFPFKGFNLNLTAHKEESSGDWEAAGSIAPTDYESFE